MIGSPYRSMWCSVPPSIVADLNVPTSYHHQFCAQSQNSLRQKHWITLPSWWMTRRRIGSFAYLQKIDESPTLYDLKETSISSIPQIRQRQILILWTDIISRNSLISAQAVLPLPSSKGCMVKHWNVAITTFTGTGVDCSWFTHTKKDFMSSGTSLYSNHDVRWWRAMSE